MTETWTSATLAGINYFGRDLNIGDFGQHQLLWPEFEHRQLWTEVATMVETSLGFFFFFFFFPSTKEN
jgi:hypothetical protein